ncbi:MAG: YbaK/EbsC family protein [Chloroflexota bacterium]|nr:YbaK/EbsC family protein [Chloroflexota bacterium]
MQAMGLKDVQLALERLELEIEIMAFDSSTATSQQAADSARCELGQIVKSLGFLIEKSKPVLVLASGDQSVDDRKLAPLFQVGRKKVRMMNPEQCLSILGYAPGGVPPLGHRQPDIPVILDDNLRRYDIVYAAGGAANAIFPIELAVLRAVTQAVFADIAKA